MRQSAVAVPVTLEEDSVAVTWALKLLRFFSPAVDKAFGSLCYDHALSAYSRDYCVKTLEQSILETEKT